MSIYVCIAPNSIKFVPSIYTEPIYYNTKTPYFILTLNNIKNFSIRLSLRIFRQHMICLRICHIIVVVCLFICINKNVTYTAIPIYYICMRIWILDIHFHSRCFLF